MRDSRIFEHDLAGRDLSELIGRTEPADFLSRPSRDRVDRYRYIDRCHRDIEPVRRSHRASGAIEVELQGVAHGNGDTCLRRSLPRRNWRNQHLGELVANALVAQRWITAVERLETAGQQRARG